MNSQGIEIIKKILAKYWGRLLSSADKDKLKSSISPDRDWWHLVITFFALILFFIAVSGYFYFSIKWAGISQDISGTPFSGGADEQKIKNAVEAINVLEADFEKLIESKPSVSDPSR